jgi:hypothetical protein
MHPDGREFSAFRQPFDDELEPLVEKTFTSARPKRHEPPGMKIDYRITLHAGATQPEQTIEIRDLPDLILGHVASRRPGEKLAGADTVTPLFVRILRDLARDNESKFGFDGRRITFAAVGIRNAAAPPSRGAGDADWL